MAKDIFNILSKIQSELKAPKSQLNSFGKYKYRSCEDILEAIKPLLLKHNSSLILTDDILFQGDRFYVKATATIYFDERNSLSSVGLAREPENKKGSDQSQITGAASSYARKYALNGLFAIDDTEDADTQDNSQNQLKPELTPANSDAWNRAVGSCKANGNLDIVLAHMIVSNQNQKVIYSQAGVTK